MPGPVDKASHFSKSPLGGNDDAFSKEFFRKAVSACQDFSLLTISKYSQF